MKQNTHTHTHKQLKYDDPELQRRKSRLCGKNNIVQFVTLRHGTYRGKYTDDTDESRNDKGVVMDVCAESHDELTVQSIGESTVTGEENTEILDSVRTLDCGCEESTERSNA